MILVIRLAARWVGRLGATGLQGWPIAHSSLPMLMSGVCVMSLCSNDYFINPGDVVTQQVSLAPCLAPHAMLL